MTTLQKQLINAKINELIQFILSNVEDECDWQVQKRLNQIESLYWECFENY